MTFNYIPSFFTNGLSVIQPLIKYNSYLNERNIYVKTHIFLRGEERGWTYFLLNCYFLQNNNLVINSMFYTFTCIKY